ncbi:MAG: hypothetical protein AAF490_13705 [Chloroflexota bacterium]
MKKPMIAAVLNFFLMGAGTLYNGKRVLTGIGLTIAALVLTYVEFGIRPFDGTLYWLMFGAVFLANTVLAIDGYQEAKMINQS